MFVGDKVARWVYNNEPTKFAAIELVPKTSSDVPETLLGHLNSKGQVIGGFAIPGLASWLSDPATGTSTVVKGLDSVPASERPTDAEVNVVHLAWDVMVGMATLLFLLAAWYALSWLFRRDNPKRSSSGGSPRPPASRRSSRSRPVGSSPRSVANPGSSSTTSR